VIVKKFSKVLIANRGEIACRIMRTCRLLGVGTVAVYSDADARSLHVRSADEAVYLGGSPPHESYLSIGKIIAAAKNTAAEAIHPGYGFLAENAEFAQACTEAGVMFIGPPASAIRAMGSKSSAKALMEKAGVPTTPGYHGDDQEAEFLLQRAEAIGYPLLIKATAGGGGKGMRRVDDAKNFLAALASCKREAMASFGDDRVLLERYIVEPRHIEIQIFADTLGHVVSLFERDCSVQRRHQKILEEAPAPGMTATRRAAMSKAACDAARAIGYVGAGTVEFIVDQQGNFHFMEMNTRLQVEHPITEMITRLDLVEWQLRVAAGEPLPRVPEQLAINGHALEARIYAEDPANGFLPSTGKLLHLKMPRPSKHVRIDTGFEQGDEITPFYDPMIAKLIVWDGARDRALDHMRRALGELQVVGVTTNVDFLKRLIVTPSFENGNIDTALIEREKDRLLAKGSAAPDQVSLLAALTVVLRERATEETSSPWALRDGWRLSGLLVRRLQFLEHRDTCTVDVEYRGDRFRMSIAERSFDVEGDLEPSGELAAAIDGVRIRATAIEVHGVYHIFFEGEAFAYKVLDPLASRAREVIRERSLLSPMPGVVSMLLAERGRRVEKGTPLLVLEAMKMEYTIEAPTAGTVESFFFNAGDRVAEGTELLRFEPDAESANGSQ
jgi:3-methylcrotonyl-CoA carboxylase alpha subunit